MDTSQLKALNLYFYKGELSYVPKQPVLSQSNCSTEQYEQRKAETKLLDDLNSEPVLLTDVNFIALGFSCSNTSSEEMPSGCWIDINTSPPPESAIYVGQDEQNYYFAEMHIGLTFVDKTRLAALHELQQYVSKYSSILECNISKLADPSIILKKHYNEN